MLLDVTASPLAARTRMDGLEGRDERCACALRPQNLDKG